MLDFARDTRAGATALTAVAITVMTLGATALIVDHVWLVHKRDLLKAATDAGSLAATLRLRGLSADVDQAAVNADLQATAERYVWLNLAESLRDEALTQQDLTVVLDVNRAEGTVGVSVDAPIGRTLLSSMMLDYSGPEGMAVGAGAEAGSGALWAVLALDVSRTMNLNLAGNTAQTDAERRINIVKAAAKDFLDAVEPNPDTPVAVGIVPWARSVASGVLAPASTRANIDARLDALSPTGGATGSSRGLEKARDLLDAAPEGARLAIVLLTDGQDNVDLSGIPCRLTVTGCAPYRKTQCDAAKADGIAVFVISAMASTSGALATELRECASSPSHAFINTRDAQAMRDTFGAIAGQIQALRRTY